MWKPINETVAISQKLELNQLQMLARISKTQSQSGSIPGIL